MDVRASLEGLDVTPEFWNKRRVFITGHTGFKGSWLALWLRRLGARVTGYSLPPLDGPSLFELAGAAQDVESVFADIRDLAALQRAIAEAQPEIVIHLAAQSLVRKSYNAPVDTIAVNVMGTANVLESIRAVGSVVAAIVVTSDKCYENREWIWGYRESDPMGGHDPYSASKGAAEIIAASYRRSYFATSDRPAVATVRSGNVIGGGDFASYRLIPDCVRAIESKTSLRIRNPASTRPWQFVLDPLAGYLTLAERLTEAGHSYAEAWNFGPASNVSRPVRWLCERFVEHLGTHLSSSVLAYDEGDRAQPHEARMLRLDISKANQLLQWTPRFDIEKSVIATARWYSDYLAGRNLRNGTQAQIDDFQMSRD